jgi:hypothetical protein
MADPVVSPGSFTLSLPLAAGEAVGTMTATNSPTAWSITAGDPSHYYAIDNSGNITITSAGAAALMAGTTVLTVQATATYAGWDPSTALSINLTNSNLTQTALASGNAAQGAMTPLANAKTSGKWYFEFHVTAYPSGGTVGVGVCTTASTIAGWSNNGTTGIGSLGFPGGQIWSNGGVPGSTGAISLNSWIGIAIDLDNRRAWFRASPASNWNNNGTANPATNTGGLTIPAGAMVAIGTFTGVSMGSGTSSTVNFGATAFAGVVPSGFTAGWTL